MKPVCVDLFCGLGGWSEGFLAEGYHCRGYDIEAHDYGTGGYPGELILRDVRSITGAECKDAAVIVASPPCTEPSYRMMPWKRAKALNAAGPPVNFIELFNSCFRIQREASEAGNRYIPLIVENVRGAQPWVGKAKWHYGSYYLWGDVPALMPIALGRKMKTPGPTTLRQAENHNCHINEMRDALKASDFSDGRKFHAAGSLWFDSNTKDRMLGTIGPASFWSTSPKRKLASAMIAKIPFPLALHIAQVFKPKAEAA